MSTDDGMPVEMQSDKMNKRVKETDRESAAFKKEKKMKSQKKEV